VNAAIYYIEVPWWAFAAPFIAVAMAVAAVVIIMTRRRRRHHR
jgi:hypothetical protein